MSSAEDKNGGRGTAGPARGKLEHLQAQFGFRVLVGPESRPERCEVSHPGYLARWRRVAPDLYEMESTNGREGTGEEDSGTPEAPRTTAGGRRVQVWHF